jgi:D-aspartate ligase
MTGSALCLRPEGRRVTTALDTLVERLEETTFDRPPALVMNAHITGLGVARSLATHNVPVIALDRSGDGVAPRSSAVDYAATVTYPLEDQRGFQADIEAVAEAVGHEPVAFGCMDEWINALVETDPSGVRISAAEQDTVQSVLNKRSMYGLADQLDVPYPETHWLEETSPVDAAEAVGFPLVVKPARKRAFEEAIGTNVLEVPDEAALLDIVDRAEAADVEIAVQEQVPVAPGEDRSLASYVGPEGAALGVVGNARVRHPREYGTSCLVDLVADTSLRRRALEVLRAAEYYGISESEFVYDTARDEYVLLDINTRPWKWIGMPVAAGANLPYAAYSDALGDDYEPPSEVSQVRWVALRDYLTGLTEVGGDVLTDGQWRALLSGSFESASDLTTAVYRPSDPGPALRQLEEIAGAPEYYCAC